MPACSHASLPACTAERYPMHGADPLCMPCAQAPGPQLPPDASAWLSGGDALVGTSHSLKFLGQEQGWQRLPEAPAEWTPPCPSEDQARSYCMYAAEARQNAPEYQEHGRHDLPICPVATVSIGWKQPSFTTSYCCWGAGLVLGLTVWLPVCRCCTAILAVHMACTRRR